MSNKLKKNVPVLRFPEFRGQKCNSYKLSNIACVERGKFTARPRNSPEYYGGNIPFVQTGDIKNSGGKISSYSQTLNEKGLEVSKLFPKGSILLTIAANIGDVAITEIDVACPDSIVVIQAGSNVVCEWLFYHLQTIKNVFESFATQNAQKNINLEVIRPIQISIPSIAEQEKIASFLGAVDTRLNQLRRKRELLQTYKRGVMQKLFSQEVRFKDAIGSEFPDWERKKLENIGSFLGGGTPNTSQRNYWIGDIPWVSSSDLEENSIHKISITRFINKTAIEQSATKIIPPNTILIVSRVGVGKIAVSSQSLCTSQDFSNFTPKEGDIYFLAYWFVAHKKKLISISQGTSIKGFANNDLSLLKIDFPYILEQEKIANFLTAIDRKIAAISRQIEECERFKQGLLQKLFV